MPPSYTIGIEEEYFVTDLRTRNVRTTMPKKFFRASKRLLGERVTSEMLQSQIEVSTAPCNSMDAAREQIRYLRGSLAEQAARHDLAIVAASTHPLAVWHEQKPAADERYGKIIADIQLPGLRSLLCGMHVHVEVPDPAARVELMARVLPFLPVFLALSTSSPFWHGRRTGLAGYRSAAHEEMPRTGLPELFATTADYDDYVATLASAGIAPDASHIWWDIRPSARHPTLELRIPDACTRIEDAICVAALYRCLMRHLMEHPEINARLDAVERAFAEENKWRAMRYGVRASFIDRGLKSARPIADVVDDLLARLAPDADALGCPEDIRHARTILGRGSSANEQLHIYAKARLAGASRTKALKQVVDWLIQGTGAVDAVASAGTAQHERARETQ